MINTTSHPTIALEITLPEPLFDQLQRVLDTHPTESFDSLTHKALTTYLQHLKQLESN
ncbi:MAG: hypothetical protein KME12_19365 [Trichocoleus desertorum ATA4-8-CV12]|jgi:hypothetical protein|nr:hypothetical protein [Trichocoleus desertorum ATA4-8-CV12]